MHVDHYTSTGPPNNGSGFPRSSFSNNQQTNTAPRDFEYGVNVQGQRCGVLGQSIEVDTQGSRHRDSDVTGVGVHGFGENFGVFGNGSRGIAGVFGQHLRGRSGIIGAAMRNGTGVVGASVRNMGNPLERFRSVPDPADGGGTGVFGTSGTGPGVHGSSSEGIGVRGTNETGPGVRGSSSEGIGVHGISERDRAGLFETRGNVAQIRLQPLRQRTFTPKLPRNGKVGDLLLIRTPSVVGRRFPDRSPDKCTLWLCIPKDSSSDDSDRWQQVMLGQVVTGSI